MIDLRTSKVIFPLHETLDFSPFPPSYSYFYAYGLLSISTHLNLSSTKGEIFIYLSADTFPVFITPGT